MKRLAAVLFCLFLFNAIGQTSLFKNEAKELIEATDSIYDIEDVTNSKDEYNFLSEGMEPLNAICLSELKSISRNRPDELKTSKTLSTLAQLATKAWRGSHYSDGKKWAGIAKHFRRAFERSTSKFNYTKQISFRIELIQNDNKRFYYDKKPGISDVHLYKGKKPRNLSKKKKEELPDPTPLRYMTETELLNQFVSQLKRQQLISDVKRGKYAYVGLHIQLDDNTLNKNRIPTARVVLVLGARRLQKIRIKQRFYVKGDDPK